MTLLVALSALHLGPIDILLAIARLVAHFVAVAALDLGHIAWFTANALACVDQDSRVGPDLRALATAVAPLVTVTALYDTLVDAVTLAMALFSAVAADIRGLGWAVTAHMADLAADVALDVGAWLWTLSKY